jgi:hypothetical protein
VNELMGKASQIRSDLDAGYLPYLIPPVIRFTESGSPPDFSR